MQAQTYLARAAALHQAGRLAEALADYDRALALAPRAMVVRRERATALAELGRFTAARTELEAVLHTAPDDSQALSVLGIVLMELGDLDGAIARFDIAIARSGGGFGDHYNRGLALKRLGRAADALLSFARAIAIRPDSADARNNHAASLEDLGQLEGALEGLGRALALAPGHVGALTNAGNVLKKLNRLDEALACYEVAVAAGPDDATALSMLGTLLMQLRRHKEALACFDRVLALAPDTPLVPGLRLHCRLYLAQWDGFEAERTAIGASLEAGHLAADPLLLATFADEPGWLHAAAQAYVQRQCPVIAPAIPARPAGPRLKVGYFSADFRDHPVMALLGEVLEAHDRTRIELHAFAWGPPTEDPWRQRAKAAVKHFTDIGALGDAAVAALARDAGLDIAIDLMGFTDGARPGIFAHRAAPVQLNFLGFPGTLGAPFMDYLVADPALVPAAERPHYAEKLLLLPESYQPNARLGPPITPTPRAELGLPETAVVLAAFNQLHKLTPETFAAWMATLRGAPEALLWLRSDNDSVTATLRAHAEAAGIDPARLHFAAAAPRETHLARLASADLFLDSWPYNAHATASDAWRAGVPVLTRTGRSYAARVGTSLATTLGLPELIAPSTEAYIARATALATDPAQRADLRQRLSASTDRLFNPTRFARHLEQGFAEMVTRARAGLAPADIQISGLPD
jgi:predicted O-linked N-acetylglucosamine transferase (SPINDLY family)